LFDRSRFTLREKQTETDRAPSSAERSHVRLIGWVNAMRLDPPGGPVRDGLRRRLKL
jgi:hypothetical protein